MPRNDEELRGPNHRNKGGAYNKEREVGDEEYVLQYLISIL